MKALLIVSGVLLMPCLFAGFACTFLLLRCVDPTKLEKGDSSTFAGIPLNPWLPRRCYTTTGQKMWLVRNYLLAASLVLVVLNLAAQT